MIELMARQSGIQKLYHYQVFNEEFLITTLRDMKLFCSSPSNVNDPWDCKPYFAVRPMLEDQGKREEFVTFVGNPHGPKEFRDPNLEGYLDGIRRDDDKLKKAIEDCSQILWKKLSDRRIYCLTPIADSTLMWSHYAANHCGICLEFDTGNELIGSALQVRYSITYPEWVPQDANKDLLALVLTKSDVWAYEKEFRLIASSRESPLMLHGDFVLLPKGALTAIIVGCQSSDYTNIQKIVETYCPWIPVKRAVRVANRYQITIQD